MLTLTLKRRRARGQQQLRSPGPQRVLILAAGVGEGHMAAAAALKQQLEAGECVVEVKVVDGLEAMGKRFRALIEGGYRRQLRVAPRSYAFHYWTLKYVPPVRFATKLLLCGVGARRLQKEIALHNPDVIVSTYPVVTVVLSYLRRRRLRQLHVPAVATITDMTGLFFWAQPGIDTHLVMYQQSLPAVERIAGRDRAQVVRPLIADEFFRPRPREHARAALGLPHTGNVVVVSGGGWGVGDLQGAVDCLQAIPQTTIVCLTGRNERAHTRLQKLYAEAENVRVLAFTEHMPDLLAAADVLVHSTAGVTCLEASARGCPVVAYGLAVGHAKLNVKAMARQDMLLRAKNPEQLHAYVQQILGDEQQTVVPVSFSAAEAATAVLAVTTRPRQNSFKAVVRRRRFWVPAESSV